LDTAAPLLASLTRITASPGASPAIRPEPDTVAILSSEELHANPDASTGDPFWFVIVAESCADPFTITLVVGACMVRRTS